MNPEAITTCPYASAATAKRHDYRACESCAIDRCVCPLHQDEDDSLTAWGKAIAGHRAGEQA